MPAGGYQKPNNPATFSGVGAYSQRTDGGIMDRKTQGAPRITGQAYGENKDMNALQSASPLAGASTSIPAPSSMPELNLDMLNKMQAQSGLLSLDAEDDQPDLPVSDGAPVGEGANFLPPITPLIENEQSDDFAKMIRSTYAKYPTAGLFNLVKRLNEEGR